MFDLLITRTWWQYDPHGSAVHFHIYHWFNLFEGSVWLVLGGLVLARYLRHRRSLLEVAYAAAFLTFGLSDFYEARSLTSWLILLKLLNLGLLLWLRAVVIRNYYPQSKMY